MNAVMTRDAFEFKNAAIATNFCRMRLGSALLRAREYGRQTGLFIRDDERRFMQAGPWVPLDRALDAPYPKMPRTTQTNMKDIISHRYYRQALMESDGRAEWFGEKGEGMRKQQQASRRAESRRLEQAQRKLEAEEELSSGEEAEKDEKVLEQPSEVTTDPTPDEWLRPDRAGAHAARNIRKWKRRVFAMQHFVREYAFMKIEIKSTKFEIKPRNATELHCIKAHEEEILHWARQYNAAIANIMFKYDGACDPSKDGTYSTAEIKRLAGEIEEAAREMKKVYEYTQSYAEGTFKDALISIKTNFTSAHKDIIWDEMIYIRDQFKEDADLKWTAVLNTQKTLLQDDAVEKFKDMKYTVMSQDTVYCLIDKRGRRWVQICSYYKLNSRGYFENKSDNEPTVCRWCKCNLKHMDHLLRCLFYPGNMTVPRALLEAWASDERRTQQNEIQAAANRELAEEAERHRRAVQEIEGQRTVPLEATQPRPYAVPSQFAQSSAPGARYSERTTSGASTYARSTNTSYRTNPYEQRERSRTRSNFGDSSAASKRSRYNYSRDRSGDRSASRSSRQTSFSRTVGAGGAFTDSKRARSNMPPPQRVQPSKEWADYLAKQRTIEDQMRARSSASRASQNEENQPSTSRGTGGSRSYAGAATYQLEEQETNLLALASNRPQSMWTPEMRRAVEKQTQMLQEVQMNLNYFNSLHQQLMGAPGGGATGPPGGAPQVMGPPQMPFTSRRGQQNQNEPAEARHTPASTSKYSTVIPKARGLPPPPDPPAL